jgi:hypothetical protein
MNDYQSFRRTTWTPYLWSDLLIRTLLCAVLLYVVGIAFLWIESDSFDPSFFSWKFIVVCAVLFTFSTSQIVFILRIYHHSKEVVFHNSCNFPMYNRIKIDHIDLVLIYLNKKWRYYNIEIITKNGKKYRVSAVDYQEFARVLLQCNPQIIVREFA